MHAPSTHRSRAAVSALLLAALTGCTTPAPEPGTTSPLSPSASTAPPGGTSSPTPTSTVPDVLVPVYYATDTGTEFRLAREFRRLPDEGGAALTAARAVVAGAPLDPDYAGLWAPEGEVLSVETVGTTIEVDLTEAATRTTTGSAGADLAVQAIVYAVTGALGSDAAVRFLVEGEPVDELFGVLDMTEPISRHDPLATRQLVQINDPNEGDVLSGTVTVTGEAAVFEATLPWEVRTLDGAVVQSGFTMTTEGQTFAPFSLELTLEPGEYVVELTEDDPSGGEGRPPDSDSRTFTVG